VTGSVYYTTIGYPPEALSTYVGPQWIQLDYEGISSRSTTVNFVRPAPASWFQAINYTELQGISKDTYSNPQDSRFIMWSIGGPKLKMPQALKSIDPEWNVCTVEWLGMVDPPRVLTKVTATAAPTSESSPSLTASPPSPGSGIASTLLPPSSTPPPSARTTRSSASLSSQDPAQGPTPILAETESQRSTDPEHLATGTTAHSEGPKPDPKSSISPKGAISSPENTSRFSTDRGNQPLGTRTDETVDLVLSMPFFAPPFQPSADFESLHSGTGVASNLENTTGLSTNDGSRVSDSNHVGIVDPVLATTSTTESSRPFLVSGSTLSQNTHTSAKNSASRLLIDDPHVPQQTPSTHHGRPSSEGVVNNVNGGIGSSTITLQSDDRNVPTFPSPDSISTTHSKSTSHTAGQSLAPESRPQTTSTSLSSNTLSAEPTLILSTPEPFLSASDPPSATNVIMTFANSTYTTNRTSEFLISAQTLASGKTITVDGTPISYAPETTAAPVPGLGGRIMSGFGPRVPGKTDTGEINTSGNSTGYAGGVFAGGAQRCAGGAFVGMVWGIMGVGVFVGF